jgi:hypothetical protein
MQHVAMRTPPITGTRDHAAVLHAPAASNRLAQIENRPVHQLSEKPAVQLVFLVQLHGRSFK